MSIVKHTLLLQLVSVFITEQTFRTLYVRYGIVSLDTGGTVEYNRAKSIVVNQNKTIRTEILKNKA